MWPLSVHDHHKSSKEGAAIVSMSGFIWRHTFLFLIIQFIICVGWLMAQEAYNNT